MRTGRFEAQRRAHVRRAPGPVLSGRLLAALSGNSTVKSGALTDLEDTILMIEGRRRQIPRLPRREELGERLLRLGGQLIRAEKLEAAAADSCKDSVTLQLPQNTPRHLTASSHEPGQVCPGQDDFLPEEQGPMLFENPKHSEPCVLMKEALNALHGLM